MTTEDNTELRKILRQILGQPEPEPTTGNVVPAEGRNASPLPISPRQYALDFLSRLTGVTPAYAEVLPEPEKDSQS